MAEDKCKCGREIYCKSTGECSSCYAKSWYKRRTPEQRAERNRKQREKYASDPDYRARHKRKTKINQKVYYAKKSAKEPNWNAKRQREWRRDNPKAYVKLMVKSYLKRLEPNEMLEVIEEVLRERGLKNDQ